MNSKRAYIKNYYVLVLSLINLVSKKYLERQGKSFELKWEPNKDNEQDDGQEEVDLSDFQGKENAGLMGKKSQCSGEDNLRVSYRIKVKPHEGLKPPSRKITSAPASSLKKTSELKQLKLPQIASANEYHAKRECKSSGSTRRQNSSDFTTSEPLHRPLRRRPRTCDSQLSNLQFQRNLPVLPKIKQKPSVQFPSLLQDEIRDGTPEHLIPRTRIRSEWDANNKSSSWNEYNSVAAERDSDLERERKRIQKLCRAQNDLRRASIEEESYPVCYGTSQSLCTSFVDVPEQNEEKGTRLPELKSSPQSMLFLRRLNTSSRVRPISSCTSVPLRSTSTRISYLSCRKSSVAQRCSGSSEATLDTEESKVRTHRESMQKLDVYEFLREEYETTASMEQPASSSRLSKDCRKAMRDVFQFLKTL